MLPARRAWCGAGCDWGRGEVSKRTPQLRYVLGRRHGARWGAFRRPERPECMRNMDLPWSVEPAMLFCRACLVSHLDVSQSHVGEVAPAAEEPRANQGAPPLTIQRPPKPLRAVFKQQFTSNCPPRTHVGPTTRRLGGCLGSSLLSCCRKEHAVHARIRAAAAVYVAVVLKLSWSSANHAQLLSWVPLSA